MSTKAYTRERDALFVVLRWGKRGVLYSWGISKFYCFENWAAFIILHHIIPRWDALPFKIARPTFKSRFHFNFVKPKPLNRGTETSSYILQQGKTPRTYHLFIVLLAEELSPWMCLVEPLIRALKHANSGLFETVKHETGLLASLQCVVHTGFLAVSVLEQRG